MKQVQNGAIFRNIPKIFTVRLNEQESWIKKFNKEQNSFIPKLNEQNKLWVLLKLIPFYEKGANWINFIAKKNKDKTKLKKEWQTRFKLELLKISQRRKYKETLLLLKIQKFYKHNAIGMNK